MPAASSAADARPPQPPQEVAEVTGHELCPSLRELTAAHRPQSRFDHLLLVFHCLMVEAGFAAVDSLADTEDAAGESPPDFALSASASQQLAEETRPASVSILYRYRRLSGARCAPYHALLKVVNTGETVTCYCGLATAQTSAPVTCAVRHFNAQQHLEVTAASTAGQIIMFNGLHLLSQEFKNCIAEPVKAAIHDACGLPPPGLTGLPSELVLRVLRACDFHSVCRLAQASRRLSGLCADGSVWRQLLARHFGATELLRRERAAELQGTAVDFRAAFQDLQTERARLTRAVARRGSLELTTIPRTGPHQQSRWFPQGAGAARGPGNGRHSIGLLPDELGWRQLWGIDANGRFIPQGSARLRFPPS